MSSLRDRQLNIEETLPSGPTLCFACVVVFSGTIYYYFYDVTPSQGSGGKSPVSHCGGPFNPRSVSHFSFPPNISFPSVPFDGTVGQSRPHRTPTVKQIIRRSLEHVCCGGRKLGSHDVGSERACLLVNMLPVGKAAEEIGTTALSGVTGRKLMCEIRLPARFHREPPRIIGL